MVSDFYFFKTSIGLYSLNYLAKDYATSVMSEMKTWNWQLRRLTCDFNSKADYTKRRNWIQPWEEQQIWEQR